MFLNNGGTNMNDQAAFAVPKDRQDVTVHLSEGGVIEGSIFLEYSLAERTLLQKVTAFLEAGNAFFPLRLNEGGATEFINKKNVTSVELAYSPDAGKDSLALSLMYSVGVTAVFTNGTEIGGALLAEVPLERARLSDCLNLPQQFLSIKVDGKIRYINKNALQKVVHADKA
jgi:hypothetical protein